MAKNKKEAAKEQESVWTINGVDTDHSFDFNFIKGDSMFDNISLREVGHAILGGLGVMVVGVAIADRFPMLNDYVNPYSALGAVIVASVYYTYTRLNQR